MIGAVSSKESMIGAVSSGLNFENYNKILAIVAVFFFWALFILEVNAMKIGTLPIGSTTTNRAITDLVNSFIKSVGIFKNSISASASTTSVNRYIEILNGGQVFFSPTIITIFLRD